MKKRKKRLYKNASKFASKAIKYTLKTRLGRARRDALADVFAMLGALGTGALLMYIFDPDQGRHRRALAGDKLYHYWHKASQMLQGQTEDLMNRTDSLAAESESAMQDLPRSDNAMFIDLTGAGNSQAQSSDASSDFIQPGSVPTNQTLTEASDTVAERDGSAIVMSRIIDTATLDAETEPELGNAALNTPEHIRESNVTAETLDRDTGTGNPHTSNLNNPGGRV